MSAGLFQLGPVVASSKAKRLLERKGVELADLLTRFAAGDWIDEPDNLQAQNLLCIHRKRGEVVAAYLLGGTVIDASEKHIYIETALDGRGTTVRTAREFCDSAEYAWNAREAAPA